MLIFKVVYFNLPSTYDYLRLLICTCSVLVHVFAKLLFTPFLPRDAMHKRGLCRHAVSVCLWVCLSVCLSRS